MVGWWWQAVAAGLIDQKDVNQMEEHIGQGRFSRQCESPLHSTVLRSLLTKVLALVAAYIAMWTERLQIAGIRLKTQLLSQVPTMPQSGPDLALDTPRDRPRLSNRLAYEREKRGMSAQPISQQHLSRDLEVFADATGSLSRSAARSPARTVPHRAGGTFS